MKNILYIIILLGWANLVNASLINPGVITSVRYISNELVFIGDGGSTEIKKTSLLDDRTILEFDIKNEIQSNSPIYLNFYLRNIDRPAFTDISVFSYIGNGNPDLSDFYNTNTTLTTFNDEGITPTFNCNIVCEYSPFSIDVTDIYNTYVLNEDEFIGFVFKADSSGARYDLDNGSNITKALISLSSEKLPGATVVPVPATFWLLGSGIFALMTLSRKKPSN